MMNLQNKLKMWVGKCTPDSCLEKKRKKEAGKRVKDYEHAVLMNPANILKSEWQKFEWDGGRSTRRSFSSLISPRQSRVSSEERDHAEGLEKPRRRSTSRHTPLEKIESGEGEDADKEK
jgi:hypothetical protein